MITKDLQTLLTKFETTMPTLLTNQEKILKLLEKLNEKHKQIKDKATAD